MHRRPDLPALLASSARVMVQFAQRLVAVPRSAHCYYWYSILAIAACAAIEFWGEEPAIPISALFP